MKKLPTGLLDDGGAGFNSSAGVLTPAGNYVSLVDMLTSLQAAPLADTTALAALGADDQAGAVMVGGVPYYFDATRTDNDSTQQLVVRPGNIASNVAGRWVAAVRSFILQLTATYQTADGAVLYTVPAGITGLLLQPRPFWKNTVAWTGGTSSAIGISSGNAAYNTAGDLQGGATGDLTAALGTGVKAGTLGTKFGSSGVVLLGPGDTILFNRIASVFTAGAGKLLVPVVLL